MAWHAVAHGADAVLYWQWRSALNGQEQYHGTLLGADGTPVPAYREVQKIGAEFEQAGPIIAGTTPHSPVAMLQSYDSRWALDFQRHHKDFDPIEEFSAFYRPLELGAQAIDIISPDAPLEAYRLVVAPALNVLSRSQAERLADYIRRGGHLVLGPRSGMKDPYNALWPQGQPGPLAELVGARVEQFYALEQPVGVAGEIGAGRATVWAEALRAQSPDTRVVMRYGNANGWLEGQAAVLTRRIGEGSVTYIGAWLDATLLRKMTERWLAVAAVKPIIAGVPSDIEVCERTGNGKKLWIVINHGDSPQTVHLAFPMRRLLAAEAAAAADVIQLGPHDVGVLEAMRK